MRCVIPFFSGDVRNAHRLLRWIRDLGGCKEHTCLLVADAETPWNLAKEAHLLAKESFKEVKSVTNGQTVAGWIPGSCSLFKTAAIVCAGKPFFFLEPDGVPLVAGWLDKIEERYKQAGKPFAGPIIRHDKPNWPNPYLEGISVYPADAWARMQATWTLQHSWTQSCAGVVMPHAVDTGAVHHVWGLKDVPPVFAEQGVEGTNTMGLDKIHPTAVVFHRVKDGSLIALLRKKHNLPDSEKKTLTFWHGGDLGDIIYGLCAIKAVGGGDLILMRHAVRELMTREKANKILPLLRIQPYLNSACYQETQVTQHGNTQKPPTIDYDLNTFRSIQFELRGQGKWENIAASHLRVVGADLGLSNNGPWLTVDEPKEIAGKPVVFARSGRYRNGRFPWKQAWTKYGKQAVFVGFPSEYNRFCREIGQVDYHPTANVLDLARVIAGAKLFIGNQSAPYALAEAMKQNAMLEACPQVPDCMFHRTNLTIFRSQNTQLPEIP